MIVALASRSPLSMLHCGPSAVPHFSHCAGCVNIPIQCQLPEICAVFESGVLLRIITFSHLLLRDFARDQSGRAARLEGLGVHAKAQRREEEKIMRVLVRL